MPFVVASGDRFPIRTDAVVVVPVTTDVGPETSTEIALVGIGAAPSGNDNGTDSAAPELGVIVIVLDESTEFGVLRASITSAPALAGSCAGAPLESSNEHVKPLHAHAFPFNGAADEGSTVLIVVPAGRSDTVNEVANGPLVRLRIAPPTSVGASERIPVTGANLACNVVGCDRACETAELEVDPVRSHNAAPPPAISASPTSTRTGRSLRRVTDQSFISPGKTVSPVDLPLQRNTSPIYCAPRQERNREMRMETRRFLGTLAEHRCRDHSAIHRWVIGKSQLGKDFANMNFNGSL